jgi:hypothetical protein
MNRQQFHNYMKNPANLDGDSLAELEDLLQEYPYFQAARMLYVRNLKNLDNIKFNKQLKLAAAYINNRQYLFGLLNDIGFDENGNFYPVNIDYQIDERHTEQDSDSTDKLLALADESAEVRIQASSDPIQQYSKSFYVQELEKFIPVADLDLLLFDFPVEDKEVLDFDFDNKLPELEATMQDQDTIDDKPDTDSKGITTRDLIEQFIQHDIQSDEETKPAEQAKRMELIDDFIRINPKMPRPVEQTERSEDISLSSLKESDAFMTETLAEIYLKQGYYYKALQVYEKLSLKYPEKSVYFATQIQNIKELITNQ